MVHEVYKGYRIQDPIQSGGKAGKGNNKTTSIQAAKNHPPTLKHFMYICNCYYSEMIENKRKAIEKAKTWIDKQNS